MTYQTTQAAITTAMYQDNMTEVTRLIGTMTEAEKQQLAADSVFRSSVHYKLGSLNNDIEAYAYSPSQSAQKVSLLSSFMATLGSYVSAENLVSEISSTYNYRAVDAMTDFLSVSHKQAFETNGTCKNLLGVALYNITETILNNGSSASATTAGVANIRDYLSKVGSYLTAGSLIDMGINMTLKNPAALDAVTDYWTAAQKAQIPQLTYGKMYMDNAMDTLAQLRETASSKAAALVSEVDFLQKFSDFMSVEAIERAVSKIADDGNSIAIYNDINTFLSALSSAKATELWNLQSQAGHTLDTQGYHWGTQLTDILFGSSIDDKLFGLSGNDYLLGAAGNDALFGGDGNDILFGQTGADYLDGGAGIDTAYYTGSAIGVNVSLSDDISMGLAGSGTSGEAQGDVLIRIENLMGSNYADYLSGTNDANSIQGNAGNDTIFGYGGNDNLNGGDGNDTIHGGLGNDTIIGGAGNNALYGDSVGYGATTSNDTFVGGVGVDMMEGGNGYDTVTYASSASAVGVNVNGTGWLGDASGDQLLHIESIIGSAYNDTVYAGGSGVAVRLDGNAGNDTLTGSQYNDTLVGGTGNDTLYGSAGNDVIYGNDGNDYIMGQAGADYIIGGQGGDTFFFDSLSAFSGADTIADFNKGQGDKLDVHMILFGYDPLTSAIMDFVKITDSGPNSVMMLDCDGSGTAHGWTQYATLQGVTGLTDEQALVQSGNLVVS